MLSITPLTIIKITHTIVWLFFNCVLGYVSYAVIIRRIDKWVWFGVAAILLEGVVLVVFKLSCPLTLIARRYSHSMMDNFDIYLPNWLAKNTKLIYCSLFLIILSFLLYRSIIE